VSNGQSALYVAETTTGKFGVYTMGPNEAGGGVAIRRHDMTSFRQGQPKAGLPALGGADPAAGAGAKPPAGATEPGKK
jgi:hypothetical protein